MTPLHALIGPNDSGKSALLGAFHAVSSAPADASVREADASAARIELYVGEKKIVSDGGVRTVLPADDHVRPVHLNRVVRPLTTFAATEVTEAALGARLLRLDPDELRQPTTLIETAGPRWFLNDRGRGLAALLDLVFGRDVDQFLELQSKLTTLFPTVSKLQIQNASPTEKRVGVRLVDGTEIGANEMSEGMLYWLAFAVLPYLDGVPIVLIEEPENGLHPSRIAEVMRALRAVSEKTQVLIATHSPVVINELGPEEVTIVTRTPERGTIITPMARTKNFEERHRVYALGELWLSYADGTSEAELVGEPQPQPVGEEPAA